ncbi:hypothetical protein HZ326_29282 [Fusarium oxysporum f. sp. albedinis]|nr:hypothetical protein HZ326_29282 [Fusarium oxysporum f. sp. albedinis]
MPTCCMTYKPCSFGDTSHKPQWHLTGASLTPRANCILHRYITNKDNLRPQKIMYRYISIKACKNPSSPPSSAGASSPRPRPFPITCQRWKLHNLSQCRRLCANRIIKSIGIAYMVGMSLSDLPNWGKVLVLHLHGKTKITLTASRARVSENNS